MDLEAAKKAELERVQTMRDLDIAEAKLQTIIKMEQEDEYDDDSPEALLTTDGVHEYVREYVAAHAMEDRTELGSQSMKKTNISPPPPRVSVPSPTHIAQTSAQQPVKLEGIPMGTTTLADLASSEKVGHPIELMHAPMTGAHYLKSEGEFQ